MADTSPQIESLRAKLAADPGSRVFAQLAEALRKEGHFAEAVKVCQEGLQKHPDYAAAQVTLGRALMEAGHRREAEIALEKAITLSPGNLLANRLLGEIYLAEGDHGRAYERFTMLQQLNPGDPEVELLAARCEAALPRAEEVVAAEDEPTQSVPEPTAELERKSALLDLQTMPISSKLLRHEAEIQASLPNPEPSTPEPEPSAAAPVESHAADTVEFRRPAVGEFASGEGLTSETLAELYVQQGHFEQALRAYERLLARDPHNERWAARAAEIEKFALQAAPATEPPPAPAVSKVNEGMRGKLMQDIAMLRDERRAAKVQALKGWLNAARREKAQGA